MFHDIKNIGLVIRPRNQPGTDRKRKFLPFKEIGRFPNPGQAARNLIPSNPQKGLIFSRWFCRVPVRLHVLAFFLPIFIRSKGLFYFIFGGEKSETPGKVERASRAILLPFPITKVIKKSYITKNNVTFFSYRKKYL